VELLDEDVCVCVCACVHACVICACVSAFLHAYVFGGRYYQHLLIQGCCLVKYVSLNSVGPTMQLLVINEWYLWGLFEPGRCFGGRRTGVTRVRDSAYLLDK
jgi:hypothetical protein